MRPRYFKTAKKAYKTQNTGKLGPEESVLGLPKQGGAWKPDNTLKGILNIVTRNPDNLLKGIRNILPKLIWSQ